MVKKSKFLLIILLILSCYRNFCLAEITETGNLKQEEVLNIDKKTQQAVEANILNIDSNLLPKGRWSGTLKRVGFPSNGLDTLNDISYAYTNCDNKIIFWIQQKESNLYNPLRGSTKFDSLMGTHLITTIRAEEKSGEWVESFSWSLIEKDQKNLIVRGSRTVWNKSNSAEEKTFGSVMYGYFKKISNECDLALVRQNLIKIKDKKFELTNEARLKNLEGEVKFSYEVNSSGDLINIQILTSPHQILSDIVFNTLSEWKMSQPSVLAIKTRSTFVIDSYKFEIN